jgi:hypothetical protein
MRDFKIRVPLDPDGKRTRLSLRRYLRDKPETDLILCIEDRESVRQFADSITGVEWLPVQIDYQLIVRGERVFINQGVLTSEGLQPQNKDNLCRHLYSSAREFVEAEFDVKLDDDLIDLHETTGQQ